MPVAPAFFAAFVMRMASAVLFDPVPAMILIRPAARSHTNATTFSFSSCVSVGLSPVVPHGARASVPCSTCQSTSLPSASQSMSPDLNGVTMATVTPANRSPRVLAMRASEVRSRIRSVWSG